MSVIGSASPQTRAMLESDLQQVVEIEQATYGFPWTRGIFEDCLRVKHHASVLVLDDCLIGYVVMSMAAGEAHVLNLCLKAEFRSRGWGRRMLDEIITIASDNNVEMMLLEVRPSNVAAINLYSNLGFNEIARRKNYYPASKGREDAIVFARHLFPAQR